MQDGATKIAQKAHAIGYAYKASLIGPAHQFELADAGLSWRLARRSGVWAYSDIAAVRLSYRPVSMQAHRFRADIRHADGARLTILSTSWQTAALMTPQDHSYRIFIEQLHTRMKAAGSCAALTGGLSRSSYTAALSLLVLLAIAIGGLVIRAIATGQLAGALFIAGFAMLFGWQVGGFIRRNRPQAYAFHELPESLLP